MTLPTMTPISVMIAPNGARKTKADHAALPISPDELANEAYDSMQAGACAIHLHVRDENDRHSLDVGRYKDAIAAVSEKCGDGILVQATTEAVGMYEARAQMDMVLALRPPSVSLSIREIIPSGDEAAAKAFFTELSEFPILPQFILYDSEDVKRFNTLREEGIVPTGPAFLLFVLGRYAEGQVSKPADLLPFLSTKDPLDRWSVCAFGPQEHLVATAAIALGGHVRVGFENNLLLKDGRKASSNADLVRQVSEVSEVVGRPLATAEQLKRIVSCNI